MAYLITGIVLLIYLILAFFMANLLGLKGSDAWVLRGGLAVLGLIGAGAFLWWYREKKKAESGAAADAAGAASENDEITVLIREAATRLAAAKVEGGASVGNLPLIFVIGDAGSTKTSAMVHSGLEPELLAGQVYQNNNIAPTRSANLWFARRAIFAEAGGKLLGDNAAWLRLVRRLRPGKLASVVGKGAQAPRAALVCFDCENFTRPGAADAVAAAARNLHAKLSAISQTLGISFPVYVLFTKMDRLPFFTDFVRNLSNEEATQVLGATLPLKAPGGTGVYAEEAGARLGAAFDDIFRSLCDARIELLPRENDAAKLPGTYEFPREFRKVRGPVIDFLVGLCRPSQLAVAPFLRGFYFSGVRPIVVSDSAPVAAPRPAERQAFEAASGATGIFHMSQRAQPAPQPVAPAAASRKVPQWLFLSHFFNDVLIADHVAMGASGASTGTNLLRRVLLASAAALCLLLGIAFLVSYAGNRSLQAEAMGAARGISAAESSGFDLPSAESLQKLETLRQTLETLTVYEREGAPLRLRWGLYSGSAIYPQLRRIYFSRFHQLLFGQTQGRLLASLQKLPATPGPGDPYGPAYDTLKAYLITTSHHERSSRMFLTPVLLDHWSADRNVDAERMGLARKQFDFYAGELKVENPFPSESDSLAVERGRRYLAQFAGMERVYQNMLAEAAKTNPPLNFNRKFPGSAEVVIDTREVAGAFTKGGWDFMKNAIRNADKYFSGEQWVLGDQGISNLDRSKLEQQLRDRYNADFVEQWCAYLKSASVVRYGSLQDAARKLNMLSGNQSPLLALFWLASQNTNVDDPKVTAALQPVHAVVPPASVDRYVAPPNQGYMNALVSLQTSLEQIASQPGPANEAAAGQVLANAGTAKNTTRQIAQGFRPDAEAHVDATVQKLMEDPITYVEGLLRTLGPAELNGKGKGLCGQFRPLLAKYPFNASATAQATVQEVNAIFRKPDGALWAFYEANLQKALTRQGSQYVPNPASGVKLNPAFVSFFNQAAAFSEALYAGGSQDPHITYTLKPVASEGIQTVTLTLDGQSLKYSGGSASPKQFGWQGAGTHEAKATVKFGGGPDLAWSNNDGLWA
ncbi:MAG: hypothetical protein M1541_08125, partial [Acidobacteria bacterium]|nr:hypothetical protein [Acidobacteriota bacterium]